MTTLLTARRVEQRDHAPQGETRTVTAPAQDVRTEGRTVIGFAALYGVESEPMEDRAHGRYRETIQAGAFADVLAADGDVVLTLNHDPSRVLARRSSGTLRLRDEARGLAFEAELGDGPTAMDVRDMVRRGDLTGCSFRFEVDAEGQQWAGERRTLTRIAALHDVSLATVPAYNGPRVELRSAPPPRRDGGLRVADRDVRGEQRSAEQRTVSALQAVLRGEARDLTHATADPVEPDDLRRQVIDALRAQAVVLQAGAQLVTTDSGVVRFPTVTSDVDGAFYNELEEIAEEDPGLDELEVRVKAIKALTRLSSEAVEDSDPDVLELVRANMLQGLALRGDRELVAGNDPKGFRGLLHMTGTQTLAVDGPLTWDHVVRATGLLAEANVPGTYATFLAPRVATAMDVLKREDSSNEFLGRPQGLPPITVTGHLPTTTAADPTSTVLVWAPAQVMVVVRKAVTIEVDRSQAFDSDAVLVRGKYRLGVVAQHPEAIVKLTGVEAPPIGA